MLKWQPCQGSELLLDKDMWIDSKGSTPGFRTDQPDYSFLPDQDFDWTYSVYGDVHEMMTCQNHLASL